MNAPRKPAADLTRSELPSADHRPTRDGAARARRPRARRHRLAIFFVLAFALSWFPWPLVLLNPDSSAMVPFGPLLAAVVAAALSGGSRSVRALLGQLRHWRAGPRWYLAALLTPMLVTGTAAAITLISTSAVVVHRPLDWPQVAATFASTVILVGLFEEVGWRGYALPALGPRLGELRASLIIGAVWSLWHLPLLISEPTGQRTVAQFLILVVAQSLFLGWLYRSGRAGLLLVVLSHAAVDTVVRVVLPQFSGNSYHLIWWWQSAMWVLVAIVAGVSLYSRDRTRTGRRTHGCSPR